MGKSCHIVVNSEEENEIIDSMTDLAGYLDKNIQDESVKLAPVAEQYREVVKSAGDKLQPSDVQDLFFSFAEASVNILKVPRADFEPISNLLLFVLSSAPDFDSLVPVVLASLTNQLPTVTAQLVALVAVLGNLFNVLDSKSEQRAYVLDTLLDVATVAQTTSQFAEQLTQIAGWLNEWQISEQTKASIVSKLIKSLESTHPTELCNFLKTILAQQPENQLAIETLVTKSLEQPRYFDFGDIEALPGLKALQTTNPGLYAQFEAAATGQYSKLAGVDASAAVQRKARVTTLSRMASEKRELSYSDLQKELDIPAEDVEIYILYAVKDGLVQGRISQLSETFSVESATVFGPMRDCHWDCIEATLESWKRALQAVSDANAKAEENCKLVKLLNKVEV